MFGLEFVLNAVVYFAFVMSGLGLVEVLVFSNFQVIFPGSNWAYC